jgi:hypothetical protein
MLEVLQGAQAPRACSSCIGQSEVTRPVSAIRNDALVATFQFPPSRRPPEGHLSKSFASCRSDQLFHRGHRSVCPHGRPLRPSIRTLSPPYDILYLQIALASGLLQLWQVLQDGLITVRNSGLKAGLPSFCSQSTSMAPLLWPIMPTPILRRLQMDMRSGTDNPNATSAISRKGGEIKGCDFQASALRCQQRSHGQS